MVSLACNKPQGKPVTPGRPGAGREQGSRGPGALITPHHSLCSESSSLGERPSAWAFLRGRDPGTERPVVTLPVNRCSGRRDRAQRRFPQLLPECVGAGGEGLPGASWTNPQEAGQEAAVWSPGRKCGARPEASRHMRVSPSPTAHSFGARPEAASYPCFLFPQILVQSKPSESLSS